MKKRPRKPRRPVRIPNSNARTIRRKQDCSQRQNHEEYLWSRRIAAAGCSVRRRKLADCGIPTSGVHPVPSNCSLSAQVDVNGSLVVNGGDCTGGCPVITQTQSGGGRHFALTAGDALALTDVVLRGGKVSIDYCMAPYTTCGGGTIHAQGSGTVVNVTSTWVNGCGGQRCAYHGGGLLLYDHASLFVRDSTISHNSAVRSRSYSCHP